MPAPQSCRTCKEKIIKAVKESEEVLFHWCLLTAETAGKDAQMALEMIVNLWITIRGFSFAGPWLELL